MKLTSRSVLFFCFLILAFGLLPVYAGAADGSLTVMDMVPYDTLAYASISNLDAVYQLVIESPEWEELLGIEGIAEQLEQGKQALNFGPMLLGISIENFLNSFGHKTVLVFMGMQGPMPVAGLIIDPGDHVEQLKYAVEQAATLPAVAGAAMVEEKKYRDVPYTSVGNQSIKVHYGFLDNFLVAGIGGGFEKLIDFYKGGGESIENSANYQYMKQKVSMSSEICVYADLERAAPMVQMMAGMASGGDGEEDQMKKMVTQVALNSVKAFALSLSLSGHEQEVYLHLKPEEPDAITDLLLAPYVPMSATGLVPLENGILFGIHIGDPVELLDRGLKLAKSFGQDTEVIEGGIQQVEGGVGLKLRDDLLSALTGEFAVAAMLPKEPVNLKASKLQMVMQISKSRQVLLIGVKDEEKLKNTVQKLSKLIELKTLPLDEQTYKGSKIVMQAIPMDMLMPGVALIPAYSFRDNLLIASNSVEWVKDTIDLLESTGTSELQEKLSESRLLFSIDVGGLAGFAIDQGLADEANVPEDAQAKAKTLGSIAASFSLGPEGTGIKLISTSDDNWMTKILRGVLIGAYFEVAKQEKMEQEMKDAMEMDVEKEAGEE